MGQIITKELPFCTLQYVCEGSYNYGFNLDAILDGILAYNGSNDLFDESLGYARKRLHIIPKQSIFFSIYSLKSGGSDGSGSSDRGSLIVMDKDDNVLFTSNEKDKWVKVPFVLHGGVTYKIASPLRYLSIAEIKFELATKFLVTEPLGKIYTIENNNMILLGNDISIIDETKFCDLGDLDFTKITSVLEKFNIIKL